MRRWVALCSTGTFTSGHLCRTTIYQAVARALEQGTYRIGDLPWQAIEIDGEYYVLAEPRKAAEDLPSFSRCRQSPAGSGSRMPLMRRKS